jgi:single-stranded DNA-binding protein
MSTSVNRVTLLGRLNKRGVEVRYSTNGSPYASFMIELSEVSNAGQEFTTYVACEAWGQKAEAASEIAPGALVLFEGRLKRVKQGERWETIVSGFELTAVVSGARAHA